MLSGITARFFPEAALQFVCLLQGKLRDGVENLKLNLSSGFICICFSFLPIGLCTAAFPTEADAGGIFSCLCALAARNFDSFAQKSDNLSRKQWENAEYIFFSRKQNRRSIFEADSF